MRSPALFRMPLIRGSALLILTFASMVCKKEENGPAGPSSLASPITTGTPVAAGTGTIGTSGGSVTISQPGAPIDGMQVNFPANAYPEPRTVDVSYAPIRGHQLGSKFNPLSPLITISNGGGYSEIPMTVKIPVKVPPGHFAMGFVYDEATGELEGLPLVARDSSSMTIATRNFSFSSLSSSSGFSKGLSLTSLSQNDAHSTIVISSILELDLSPDQDTKFRPGVDDWGFTNYGSYLAPGGHCAGQSFGALWYFSQKRRKGSPPLWLRFDNNGENPKTPGIWQDDILGYRFCSVVQDDGEWDTIAGVLLTILQTTPVGDPTTFDLFAYSILMTKRPQLVGLFGSQDYTPVGHAMVIYGQATGQLYVCDPNYPGDLERRITKGFIEFDPYYSGPTATTQGIPYSHIYYMATSALVNWNSIDSRWKEVGDKTIGADKFPTYTIKVLNDSAEFVPLVDGFTKEDGHFSISVEGNGFFARFQAFDETERLLATDGPFDLRKGKHRLGICTYDREYHWVGFNWFSVTAGGDTGLIPLALRNSWTYEDKDFNSDGTLITTKQRLVEITGDTVDSGQHWYKATETIGDDAFSSYLANRTDGVWIWFPESPGVKTFLAYKYPARPGETFLSGIDGKTMVTVKDTNASTTTPSGRFDHCILYESKTEGRTTTFQVWMYRGIGQVATMSLEPFPGGGTYISERSGLVTYSVH